MSSLVVLRRYPKPLVDDFHVRLCRLDAAGRLLLKSMENINGTLKSKGIDCSIGVAAMIVDNLKNASSFTFPRFRVRVFSAKLRDTESRPNVIFDLIRECQEIAFAGTNPKQRPFTRSPSCSTHT